jgi:membrane protease YdiL (CAAX protease family)
MPALPRAPFVWKFWGTLAWSVALLIVMTATGFAVLVAVAAYQGIAWSGDFAEAMARSNLAALSSADSIAALAPVLGVIWLAVRLARQDFADYLALRLPSARHAAIGLTAVITVLLTMDTIAHTMGWAVTSNTLTQGLARNPTIGMVLLLASSLVVTTPIAEEAVFRGFIYRGFAASWLGPALAVIVSSLMFTALHVQYDAVGLAEVLANGLLLGVMRAASGSTILTIAMHALVNSVALLEAMWAAGLVR